MPVIIPAVTLVNVERKDLRDLRFFMQTECSGEEDSEVCVDVWYVIVTYIVRTDADVVYKKETVREETWTALKDLMLPAVDEVIEKINIREGM